MNYMTWLNYLNSESIFQQKKGKEFLLSRIVIDSWPFNNEVGKTPCRIRRRFQFFDKRKYKKCLS